MKRLLLSATILTSLSPLQTFYADEYTENQLTEITNQEVKQQGKIDTLTISEKKTKETKRELNARKAELVHLLSKKSLVEKYVNKQKEEARLAEEARKAEENRLAEEAKQAEEIKQVEAVRALEDSEKIKQQETSQTIQQTPTEVKSGNTKYTINSAAATTYPYGQCTWGVKSVANWAGNYWGNAAQWAYSASAEGFTVNQSPAPGAIAVWDDGGYGHVAYVTDVKSTTSIQVVESNYNGNMSIQNYRGWFNPTIAQGTVYYIHPSQPPTT